MLRCWRMYRRISSDSPKIDKGNVMKKLIFLAIIAFGVYLLWGNVETKQEEGNVNFSVNKEGVEQKLESTGNELSSKAKALEEKFKK
ncbi:MAG: hypothetical protein CMJ47_01855 [Planctomyces sp.]|nr:hypothetical protein [Planctomyces sp.]